MTTSSTPSSLRLVLWPTVVTLALSVLRLVLEVQGIVTTASGGALTPLGITWLVFVFGAWFGWRLRGAGSVPRLRFAPGGSMLLLAGLVAVVVLQFGGIDRGDGSAAGLDALRRAVLAIVAVSVPLAACTLVVWPRLGGVLLLYAIPARLTVLALTWLAKTRGWDTHYTKLGPAGIELDDLGPTMAATGLAQLGFWVPFTMVAGSFAGTVAASVRRREGPR